MSFVPAHNVTDGPIVIDFEGRTLGGGEWGAVDRHDDATSAAVDAGYLVLHGELGKDSVPEALAAADAAVDLETRRVAITDADVGHLRALAEAGELDGREADYEHIGKAELSRRLVRRTDVPLNLPPDPSTASTSDADPPTVPGRAAAAKKAAPRGGTP